MSRFAWERTALLLAGVVFALSFTFGRVDSAEDPRTTALRAIFDLDRARFGDVSPGLRVARQLSHNSRQPIYDQVTTAGSSFIYPPLAAALYLPFAGVGVESAHRELTLANHAVFVMILCVLAAFVATQKTLPAAAPYLAVAAGLLFYPLLRALEINQAGLLVVLFVGAAQLALAHQRPRPAGVGLALACAIKPHLALMLPLVALAAPAAAAAALAAGAALIGISLGYAGVANHVAYLASVLPTLSAGYVFYPNQSWAAFFGRLLLEADPSEFVLAPRDGRVQLLAILMGGLGWLATWWAIRRGGRSDPVGALGLAWLAATVLSPIAWEHHYAPALFVLIWAWAACRRAGPPVLLLPIALGFALMACVFDVHALRAPGPRMLASYVLAGATLLQIAGLALLARPGTQS